MKQSVSINIAEAIKWQDLRKKQPSARRILTGEQHGVSTRDEDRARPKRSFLDDVIDGTAPTWKLHE